jgi:hypothetical protein
MSRFDDIELAWDKKRHKPRSEMSKKQKRQQQEAMGDIEFQMEIAPQLNYQGPIDVSRARLRQTPKDLRTDVMGYNLGTAEEFSARDGSPAEDHRKWMKGTQPTKYVGTDQVAQLPIEEATVNVVNARNANPATYSHEYRHAQGMFNEGRNRKVDAYNAMNSQDWETAVEMAMYQMGENDSNGELIPASRKKAENAMLRDLTALDAQIPKMNEEDRRWFNTTNKSPYWKHVRNRKKK